MNKHIIYLVFLFLGNIYPNSFNSYGSYGYVNLPSAYGIEESSLAFNLYRGEPDRRTILTGSPFYWLDFSIFYSDITGKPYPPEGIFKQSFKDKGFHAKFNLIKESYLIPEISVGFNDFGGTGLYSSEYFVFSKRFSDRLELSTGIGWGKYSNGIEIPNPFLNFSDEFKSRAQGGGQYGGMLSLRNFFSGPASLFLGGSLKINKNTRILFELDPTQIEESYGIKFPEAKSKLNVAADFNIYSLPVKISLERGNALTVNFTLFKNYSYFNQSTFQRDKKSSSEEFLRLQAILDNNKIALKSVSEKEDLVKITVRQNVYSNQHASNEKVIRSYQSVFKGEKRKVQIQQDLVGLKVNSIIYKANSGNARNIRKNSSEENLMLRHEVLENYPIVNHNFSPGFRTFIAGREGFLYQGLSLDYALDIALQENILISSILKYSISDNFDGLYIPPRDTYPNQVRSDIKKYLNNFDRGIIFARIQGDYFGQISDSQYYHFSGGMLEEMFSGAFFEYLFFPQDSFYGIGFETTYAVKRSYEMKFKHQSYRNLYSRAFFHVREPSTKIGLNLSFGEYLAGDIGYTFELNRRFENGVKMGLFFTRTDVTKAQFGEGAFDKGIRFEIPFKSILNPFTRQSNEQLSKYEWRPLTKDPGQLVLHKERLLDVLERYRVY